MPFDINKVPNKLWMHGCLTPVENWSLVTAAWPLRDEIQHIFKVEIYPDYLENKWFIALLFKNDDVTYEVTERVERKIR